MLLRLFAGKGKKRLTTAERWKRKQEKKPVEEDDQNSINITKLTELANELLTRTGNMDIYQESYEQIKTKVIAIVLNEKQTMNDIKNL